MEILGFTLAFLIGISLGLIGGGGSILTVPVLVYLLGVNPVLSTAYSLFVVGMAASVGAINNLRKGLVSIKTAIVFAIPSFLAVYLTRLYVIPAIPDNILTIGSLTITKNLAIMVFFAIIMLIAAFSMMYNKRKEYTSTLDGKQNFNYPMIVIDGIIVGTLTGFVGAGGGFLIIPALVLLARLPMKLAVGTSLLIIAIKSLIGFLGDIQTGQAIDWSFLLLFTAFAVTGIFTGGYLSNFISGEKLKSGFAWFVLAMAIMILVKELFLV